MLYDRRTRRQRERKREREREGKIPENIIIYHSQKQSYMLVVLLLTSYMFYSHFISCSYPIPLVDDASTYKRKDSLNGITVLKLQLHSNSNKLLWHYTDLITFACIPRVPTRELLAAGCWLLALANLISSKLFDNLYGISSGKTKLLLFALDMAF